ncbi:MULTISPECIES: nucleotide-binding protein [unclassified Methanoregula]|uniref:nucleotide-binding protein n=1 Tax=unclassified Methanoregula TaxID=2649730 RepID=UPI0009CD287B|nr:MULTISPECIES: nucleotide-binding protein [unclassified Methanoregula]OPX61783.1 MAG: replication factor A [Methanoregula sp. PtaB.Bin085]OPY33908.1 MAG: replication factor A [Methanoregula sp. PtaU1.Bin006]
MDYSEAADRISRKYQKSGQAVDVKKIEGKLRRLVDEFGVQPSEAERSVINELNKEFNIPAAGSPAGGGRAGGANEQKRIADAAPGDWVTFEAKVVALSAPASPSIAQSGILADESGAIRFVVWAKSNAPKMSEGSWYRIESAVVDEFKGVPSLKVHSGTTIREIGEDRSLIPTPLPIKDLHPGIGGVRAKVVQEWDASHERMLQSGLLGDETGTIKFVIWKEPGKEKLKVGAVYSIFYAQVDEFNGRLSLNLNAATIMQEDAEIAVSGGESAVRGAIVHIAPGSGIIKRCPVEGCNRALSRQNYCPVHEIQPKFVYDLRIKGWLDDGEKTHNILLQRDATEALTGITLDAAKEIAENNPLGMDEVFLRMRDAILGRYIVCHGREIDGRLLVNKCEKVTFDSGEHAALLNRAGGAS